jgi:D-alanine-D-alanine ligase
MIRKGGIVKPLGKVAVLCGGSSSEREVSLVSGRGVFAGLRSLGEDAVYVEIARTEDIPEKVRGFDVVFVILHGGDGEGGVVQQVLEDLGIPYAGSGPRASALGMDKLATKDALVPLGIHVPRALSFPSGDLDAFAEKVLEQFSLPVVIKPTSQGASIGVCPAHSEERLLTALEGIHRDYGALFVEEYVRGRELTVSVLRIDGQDVALPILEILINTEFLDFRTKYTDGLNEMVVPAKLDGPTTQKIQDVAVMTHHALGCWGFSRVDILLDENEIPYVLETNTLPGMTPHSAMPKSAAAMGLEYPVLVRQMLLSAFDRPTAT